MDSPVSQESGEAPARLAVGLSVLFEACAAACLVLMLRLLLGFVVQRGAPQQLTAQAARMLEYWALLLYVHGLGLVWWRRAATARTGLLGLCGLLYLGCGFVFSLLLGAVLDSLVAAEDLRTLAWQVGLPIVQWVSVLLGIALLIRALLEPGGRPQPAESAGPPACRGFVALVAVSLLAAGVATVVFMVWAGRLLSVWYFKASTDRTVEFLGVTAYASVYLVASLLTLAAALLAGRRALRHRNPELLWLAGLLAVIGGLQHPVLIGWPALIAGVRAMAAANLARVPNRKAVAPPSPGLPPNGYPGGKIGQPDEP